jgi:Xaa-Pro aminopeptidase
MCRIIVFFAYAVVTDKTATVFVDESQIDNVIREHLGKDVELSSYESFFQYLEGLGSKLGLTKDTVRCLVDIISIYIFTP